MDVIESPLNMAHQQGRRADALLKGLKYEEAITCHKKAADLLLLTMRSTHNQEALQSLTLQREFHLKQEALIRQKEQHMLNCSRKANKPRPLCGRDQSESELREPLIIKPTFDLSTQSTNMSSSCQSYADNSLIKMINSSEELIDKLLIAKENPSDSHEQNDIENDGRKSSEEIREKINSVKSLAINLIKDNEMLNRQVNHFRGENEQLKEKLKLNDRTYMEESTDSEKYYPVPVGMNLHDLPSLELPPLEMPKFDFNVLKTDDSSD